MITICNLSKTGKGEETLVIASKLNTTDKELSGALINPYSGTYSLYRYSWNTYRRLWSRELGTSLTRRHSTNELFPFSYNEYCRFRGEEKTAASLASNLKEGGFPEYLKTRQDEMLTFVPMFDYSIKKQTINLKKVYTVDTGLVEVSMPKFKKVDGHKLENLERELSGLFEAMKTFDLDRGTIVTLNQRDHFEQDGLLVDNNPARLTVMVPTSLADGDYYLKVPSSSAEEW